MKPTQTELCPLCGGTNQCALAAATEPAAPCWCFSATVSKAALASLPVEQINRACLCPRCATGLESSLARGE
ncbi:MAG: cysteine-rich CWC family protein [Halopseudomonas sp.]|uniref:cysteine-rich CWC family protein n=1 Tax=Halopseudomonas sp. TaxID=2901191 RepID=UPI003001D380